ncbi:MAG: flagellar hook protein [Buchnera aphidicola (Brevicoryne brassicae)]|uniref:Flagellar hook-associated protein 1 n=1 Tax=Buchnera aphidicola (Brevicoryne brassicae) TaxID=911343 RepID=A0AAJ5PTX4_9GAMM|nr:flagellar hook protein [Buchnera aphidicola]QCI19906.1 flagellar hook protein [Buchnera aphidicola (Brevicoryne brassicae)]WAI18729.1 MAG: flagellar hook protein [Buchnera aphidicola (Brevicoryne brassicae)]
MSSMLNSAIAGINAMKIMIDKTVNKIKHPNKNNPEKRIFLENTVQDPDFNSSIKIKEIYDNYNDFITEEKRKTNSQVQYEQTKIEQLLKLEDLLCEKSNIFNELINELYEQVNKDVILNQKNMISTKAQTIINAIEDFDKRLKFLEKDIKESVIKNINQINLLIEKIHDATIDIRYFPVEQLPNRIGSFIDKRDNLVDELNDLIGIKVVKDNDSYKIYLNNGICIIDNNHKQNLIPLVSKSDDRYISVGYIDENEKKVKKIENMITSSSLGALLKFRREELTNARNKIGQLTVKFAESINSYHTLGYDVFKHFGKQVFNVSNPEIISSSTNNSSPITSAKWISKNNANDTDYVIYFKNNNWIVTRLSDRTMLYPNVKYQDNDNLSITFDGIEFLIQGKNNDGDIYMIKPYSKTLEELELLIDENDVFSLKNETNNLNRNNSFFINNVNREILFDDHQETLDESYQKFSKSIAYECNSLEEELPFKKNMANILHDKKVYMSNDIERDYQNLNYQQESYLANVKVLQIAETIFDEIIECYS